MVIDLKRCIGCNSCVIACKVEHNVPNTIALTSVLEKEVGKYPNVTRVFLPVLCNHCERAVCVEVCPTGATYAQEDGVIMIDWDKCIGCKACIEACPYDARSRVNDNRILFPDQKTTFESPDYVKAPKGVATKCDFCAHRLKEKRIPACAEVCLTGARIFGDLSDEQSPLLGLIGRHHGFQLLPEKGTEPSVYYIG
jgi:molybdopterin-containing oxidoreductase family iron-sulfur binding subunit